MFLRLFLVPQLSSLRQSGTVPLPWTILLVTKYLIFPAKVVNVCFFSMQGTKAVLSALLVPLPIIGLGWLLASPDVNTQLEISVPHIYLCLCFMASSITFDKIINNFKTIIGVFHDYFKYLFERHLRPQSTWSPLR